MYFNVFDEFVGLFAYTAAALSAERVYNRWYVGNGQSSSRDPWFDSDSLHRPKTTFCTHQRCISKYQYLGYTTLCQQILLDTFRAGHDPDTTRSRGRLVLRVTASAGFSHHTSTGSLSL